MVTQKRVRSSSCMPSHFASMGVHICGVSTSLRDLTPCSKDVRYDGAYPHQPARGGIV